MVSRWRWWIALPAFGCVFFLLSWIPSVDGKGRRAGRSWIRFGFCFREVRSLLAAVLRVRSRAIPRLQFQLLVVRPVLGTASSVYDVCS